MPADPLGNGEERLAPRAQLLQRGGTRAAAQPAALAATLAAALAVAREGGSITLCQVGTVEAV